MSVEVGALAYKKIVYHLLRYPTSRVCGIHISMQECSLVLKIGKLQMHILFSTLLLSTQLSVSLWISLSRICQSTTKLLASTNLLKEVNAKLIA